MDEQIKRLIEYAQRLYNGENGEALYESYKDDIQKVTPQQIFQVENEQLKMGRTPRELLSVVDKLINVFYHSIVEYKWSKPTEGTFLYYMMLENDALTQELEKLKTILLRRSYLEDRDQMLEILLKINEYNIHLLKLENILFPTMEKKNESFEGTKIMWSIHDLARTQLKRTIETVKELNKYSGRLALDMGELFSLYSGMIQKQTFILFPSVTEVLTAEELVALHLQSFDYGFSFITAPIIPEQGISSVSQIQNGRIELSTGFLDLKNIEPIFGVLPVDLTFVDANDKVAFFSKPEQRIFPRSVAIIGRDVANCHPAESVHVVEKILSDFKKGIKNKESFWIKMREMYILIQYFAVRDLQGEYLGTLEVSQEISEIKELQGEKRLLD